MNNWVSVFLTGGPCTPSPGGPGKPGKPRKPTSPWARHETMKCIKAFLSLKKTYNIITNLKIFLIITNLRTRNSYSFRAWFTWQARQTRRTLKTDGSKMIMAHMYADTHIHTHTHELQNLNMNHWNNKSRFSKTDHRARETFAFWTEWTWQSWITTFTLVDKTGCEEICT